MTTTAHNAKRVWGGASLARNVESGTSPQVSMFYELNPHLRKKKTQADVTIADRIAPWLREHGPATAKEIARGISAADVSSVNEQFRFDRVPGAVVVGLRRTGKASNKNAKVWGLQDIHTDDDDE